MMNPASILKLKSGWDKFTANHPKFPAFMKAAGNGMFVEGTVIEITVKDPDGKTINTNVKLTQSDLELFQELKNIK